MRINIYGLGYVGSVSAACLASAGHDVLGIDIDRLKVDNINQGRSPVVEPSLTELMHEVVKRKNLRATVSAAEDGDVSIVCVGTPSNENGSLNLKYLSHAVKDIGDFLRGRNDYHVVCVRSTVLPGTVEKYVVPVLEKRSKKKA